MITVPTLLDWNSILFARTVRAALPVFFGILLAAGCAAPVDKKEETSAPAVGLGTPVLTADGGELGTVHFPTSCSAKAQGELERGLALLHHMNYMKAESTFLGATEIDPDCAIAYWGAAMTHVHPLWPDSISDENLVRGQALLAKAAVAAHSSPREEGYLNAIGSYYEGQERTERERLASFLEGWIAVHADNQDDTEAALFHALSLLATAEASDKSYQKQIEAGEIIEGVMARIARHPGAHHYTIHAYDFPPLAPRALEIARRYDDLAPENTHALHMTSHIFTRLGLWQESVDFNIRAAAASSERTAKGEVPLHHLHALDYLAYAHLQTANDVAADAVLAGLQALEPPFQNHSATAYGFAGVPARLALERHDWEAAAALEVGWPDEVNWQQYPYLESISYFARALGAAHTGKQQVAKDAIAEFSRLEEAAKALNIAYDWGTQVAIQRLAAESWLAYESGDTERGLELGLEAAEMEGATEKNPVTPGEVLPARELYGDMLRASGQYQEAIAAYEIALKRSPNRFNGLYGAGRAAELAGDGEVAKAFYGQLVEICSQGIGANGASRASGVRPELEHARAYLKEGTGA